MKHLAAFVLALSAWVPWAHAETMTLYVEMACGNCSSAIEQAMEKNHKGKYQNLKADFDRDVVTLETTELSRADVVATIEYVGFDVSDTPIKQSKK